MKRYITIFLVLILIISFLILFGRTKDSQESVIDTSKWTLIEAASDEFNGSSLDEEKWNNGIWYDVSSQLAFKEDNVIVRNGNLELQAKMENYKGKAYTIGAIESKFEVPGVNSYVEIRAKLLDSKANVLSAIWMQSSPLSLSSNNPEIDIHESFDYHQYEQALHTWMPGSSNAHRRHAHHRWGTGVEMSQDYHTYGLERIGNQLKFYFDDQLAWEKTMKEKSFGEMSRHMVLSLEGHLGTPNSNYLPAKFLIDYVRTYYRNDLTNIPLDGTYKLINRKSGLALSVPSSSVDNGTQLVQGSYEGNNNEKWNLKKNPDLTYKILNMNSKKYMDVRGRNATDGEEIIQFDNTEGINQNWIIEPVKSGYYRILSLDTGKALVVKDASIKQGAPIVQWSYGEDTNGQWEIINIAN